MCEVKTLWRDSCHVFCLRVIVNNSRQLRNVNTAKKNKTSRKRTRSKIRITINGNISGGQTPPDQIPLLFLTTPSPCVPGCCVRRRRGSSGRAVRPPTSPRWSSGFRAAWRWWRPRRPPGGTRAPAAPWCWATSATRAWVRAQDPAPPRQQRISLGSRTRVGAAAEVVRLGWEVGTSNRVPPLVRRQPAPSLGVPHRAPTRTKTSNVSCVGTNPAASTTASSRVKVSHPIILCIARVVDSSLHTAGLRAGNIGGCKFVLVFYAIFVGFRLDTCRRARVPTLLWIE